MEGMEYFYELYDKLPRGGPGDNQSTRRAFSYMTELPEKPLMLDIGCGPGMQTLELASLSQGKIIAIDNHQPFLGKLMRSADAMGLARNIIIKNMSMLEMDFDNASFDVIWSEGSLYFLGFQNGLARCRELLKKGGYLAVTEAVYLTKNLPAPVKQFWESEYPDIKNIDGNIEVISNTGLCLIEHFTLPKSSWLDHYYFPMEKELEKLVKKYAENDTALALFSSIMKEIDFYKKYSDYYGYEFFIMRKIT